MLVTSNPEPAAGRFIAATLELIAEEGGSQNVNLRQIARRIGCAHTNLYNFFADYQDLLWAAFRRALRLYGQSLIGGLDDTLSPRDYLRRLVTNLATFPEEQPGLYRFIASDPIPDEIPDDILLTVTQMKLWLSETFGVLSGLEDGHESSESAANIVLAYIDGETLNLINGRVAPDEDVRARIVDNAVRLFDLLIADGAGAAEPTARAQGRQPYPPLTMALDSGGV